MKIFKSVPILFLSILFFAGCESSIENQNLRASAVSVNGDDIVFRVYPENSSGDIMTGSLVTVTNSENEVLLLEFDNDSQCYISSFDGLESDIYNIKVISAAYKEAACIQIPHLRLTKAPTIVSFSDSMGNSVLSGKSINSQSAVSCAWNSLGNGIVYQVSIKTVLSRIWTGSTSACNIEIPKGTLTAGKTYYLYLTAQKICGDPYFSLPYYSFSSITSSAVTFYVEE